MKEIRRITFTGKNLNDVFNLPCVYSIVKIVKVPQLLLTKTHVDRFSSLTVQPGDELVEYENKKWKVIKK